MRGSSAADLKAAARTLAAGLRQAQTMAMATRRDSALTVDVESREFHVAGDSSIRQLPKDLEIKLTRRSRK
jgi:general secretion pathway protein H